MSYDNFVKLNLSMSRVLGALTPLFIFIFVQVLTVSVRARTNEASPVQISLMTPQFESHPGKVETIKLKMQLPSGYHAYKDQLRVQNVAPTEFKSGQLKIFPESKFFDKFSNRERSGFKENGEIEFQIESPTESLLLKDKKSHEIEFSLRYQICSEKICYLPKTKKFKVDFHFEKKLSYGPRGLISSASTAPETTTEKSSLDFITFDPHQSIALTLFLIFLAGILTSFTPCIFPMIPITLSILGHNAHQNSRAKNLSRSTIYVLGIAMTYAVLGVAAALTGSLFGKFLAHPVVIWSMAALFAVMALSMWGLFEIQAPAFIRKKFQSGRVSGYSGIFVMGLVAGVVASPCVGPVLVSILSFVSTTQNAVLGFIYLFTYAVGLGLIFIVIGLFSEVLKLLPRSGGWMDTVKFFLGLIMIVMALYYLRVIVSPRTLASIGFFTFILICAWKANDHLKNGRRRGARIFWGGAATFALVFLATLFRPALLNLDEKIHQQVDLSTVKSQGHWVPYTEDNLKQALAAGKPIIIDFFAEWCGACHELKAKTFSTAEFAELSKNFTLLVLDATEDTDENQKILTKYGVQGLPTVYFMTSNGEHLKNLTFTQFIEWPEMKVRMEQALK